MFRLTTLFCLTIVSAHSAPEWREKLSGHKVGSHPMIEPSKLEFTLSWKGMVKAGAIDIEFAPRNITKPGALVVKSSASSRGAAATLFPYSHSYWSEIYPNSLKPRYFQATETDSKEKITTTNRYTNSSVSIVENSLDLKGGKTTIEKVTFPHGPAMDVFSAVLFVRSQNLNVGDKYSMLILPFKSPYLLTVQVQAKEKHMGKDAIRMSFSMRKIDRDTLEFKQYKKLKRPVTLWLSDDKDRVPLELRAAVYIGDVRAVLTKFTKYE